MSDDRARAAERAWLANPTDPRLRDEVASARRRAGLTVAPELATAIPRHRPRLLWERQVIPHCWGWTGRPVVDRGRILLAGGSADAHGEVGLAQVLALEDGRELLVHRELPELAREVQAALPALAPDGSLLVAIYEHPQGVSLLRLGPAGELLARQEVPAGFPTIDGSSKLFLGPLVPLPDGSALVSWVYRQVRRYGTSRHGSAGRAWEVACWLGAIGPGVAIGVTTPGPDHLLDRTRVVAHDLLGGEVRWERDAPHATIAGLLRSPAALLERAAAPQDELLLLVDRSARFAEKRAASEQAEEARAAADPEDERLLAELDAREVALPRSPTRLLALALSTGAVEWSADFPGELVGVAACPTGVSVLAHDERGLALHHLDRAGRLAGSSSLDGPPLRRWGHAVEQVRPALVARDLDVVLVAGEEQLVAHGLAGDVLWNHPLPARCEGFRERRTDRFLPLVQLGLGDGRIALRDGERLWVLGV